MNRTIHRLGKRLRAILLRRQLDRDLEDELRFHLEMKAAETGDPGEARRKFGNAPLIKENCREMWTFSALETWAQDIRYGFRTLAKTPSLVCVVVAALALGIGANTTIFTIVSRALSFDLGVDHVERVVFIDTAVRRGRSEVAAILDLQRLLPAIKTITHLSAYRFQPLNVSDRHGFPDRYFGAQVTPSAFDIMGRQPTRGRLFTREDVRAGATPVILMSHHVWMNRYGSDPSVVGQTILVNDVPRAVIGIMPPGIRFPEDADFWIPLTPTDLLAMPLPVVIGRLADGVKLAAARAEVNALARQLVKESPDNFKGLAADVKPLLVMYGVYDSRNLFRAMFLAVGFVLLIACADVANLLLSRAASRSREISIRIAIGAGRSRIIRQLLVESVMLSIASGLFGWLVALAGLRWFDRFTSRTPRPSWLDFSMDSTVFFYLAAISIGAGILFGLAPALQLAKVDVNHALKSGGQGAVGGTRGRGLFGLLVIFEMALSVVLLAGAGLMIRSSVKLYNSPIGVNAANVLTMNLELSAAKYPRSGDQVEFHRNLKKKLEALPGVEVAALTSDLPGRNSMEFSFELDGQAGAECGLLVSPGYFRVMQVRPTRGRLFSEQDSTALPVALVNESFVAKYRAGEDPLGHNLRLSGGPAPPSTVTIIGVVPDINQNLRHVTQKDPLIYLPYGLAPRASMFVVARTQVPPGTLVRAFRREVQSLDGNLPASGVRSLEDLMAQDRMNVDGFSILFTAFAVIALVLAAIGLYGVMAHSVSLRRQEIGIRMAMGGQTGDILSLVFGQGLRQVGIGIAIGMPLAFVLTRALSRALVGVSPGDPVTFAGVVLVLILAGVLGCVIPARRAVRVDPLEALRAE